MQILAQQPDNGFAQCHLGFILKTGDNDHEAAVKLLQAGIDSQDEGTQDGRFFFHLGDAYNRLGRPEEVGFGFLQKKDKCCISVWKISSLYLLNP